MNKEKFLFARFRWLYIAAVVIIFLVGAGIRLYDLKDIPLDFHPTRQLHSALIARGMYYENLESAPDWQRETAVRQWKAEGLIEPPIMERLAAFGYQLAGDDLLWIPRLYAIVFWLLGGFALLLLTKELTDENGAVAALLFYLVNPYAAIASRAFQPDPLMVTLILYALWAIIRWQRAGGWKWAVLAGVFGGLAIFVKSVAVFPILFAFAAVVISKVGFKSLLRSPQVWLIAVLAVLPYAIYHIYGVYINGEMQSQFSLRFFPQLWKDPGFWLRWHGMINQVVGLEFFLAAILGIFLLKRKSDRTLLIALFAGYFVYGMALSYHISTHDYYQLPLFPVVAIGLAAVVSVIFESLQGKPWLVSAGALLVLSYFMVINAWDVRVTLKRSDYRNEEQFWIKIGELFTPEDSIIGITQDYGYRMAYWGWRTPTHWMTSADFAVRELAGQEFDMEAVFYEQIEGKTRFLVTRLSELDRQPKVKALLNDHFLLISESPDYLIYDLTQPQN